ncbi:hypothetical protein [Kribbella sp. NPDC048915]|uniref:hypothetical protein n=1 Tax=Kribbella sp. NPDC048915 TaxID=3155148 RepID=UPI0033DD9495
MTKIVVRFFPVAAIQPARSSPSAWVISGSTRTASRSPWIRVAAVGDHIRRTSPGGN